ncbi:MAG: futalosine hydrolase [Thermobacillus sp.]|uniref:futalosine hydrolase n=2 Tax=Thermobacillus TaxID=76632 RepID=UPI000E378403|nr:futalosine hydrolase [Thermobacillus sp.]REK58016.1 MAG: futalosine hydrolase [Thermobacillus sp.]
MRDDKRLAGTDGQTEKAGRAAKPDILIMTAVEAERDAVLRGLAGCPRAEVRLGGVGPASAAARTAAALAGGGWRLVISAGIGGGFAGAAGIGDLVLADVIAAADLGVETPDGFLPVDELGFGTSRIAADPDWSARLARRIEAAGLPLRRGPVLTVSTATGTAATAAERARRVPGAAAEAMEGFGVAAAAAAAGVPVAELRAVSNAVGPRDRAAWRIPDALAALESAFAAAKEVFESR